VEDDVPVLAMFRIVDAGEMVRVPGAVTVRAQGTTALENAERPSTTEPASTFEPFWFIDRAGVVARCLTCRSVQGRDNCDAEVAAYFYRFES